MGVHMACITSGGRLSNLIIVRGRSWVYIGRRVLALELASKLGRGLEARMFIGMFLVFQRKSRIREITSLAAKGVGEGWTCRTVVWNVSECRHGHTRIAASVRREKDD